MNHATVWTSRKDGGYNVKFKCPECGEYIKGISGLDGRCRACDAAITGPEFPAEFWEDAIWCFSGGATT